MPARAHPDTFHLASAASEPPAVDVYVLSRPGDAPGEAIRAAIGQQRGIHIFLHQHIGWPAPGDTNRWMTIARARNQIKQRGFAQWGMFVDDDVLLDRDCVRTLLAELIQSPMLGAIAADYRRERGNQRGHVAMGACLFRKSVLQHLSFRSTAELCECQCCCDDLRSRGVGIAYSHRAIAAHHSKKSAAAIQRVPVRQPHRAGVVLAAFDRRDIQKFEKQFLVSLRAWGNRERVIAVAYGLYPSELRRLSAFPGVTVVARPVNGTMVPVRRLEDFATVVRRLHPSTPVAYWDVADVVFQTPLGSLWEQVLKQPRKLHAVAEPKGYPYNAAIPAWSLSIRDRYYRAAVFKLLQRNPFLNSGFAAGTAAVMFRYFSAASRYLTGPPLAGTTDWGDQICLNYYCHSQPDRWVAIDEGWNFCVHDRPMGDVMVCPSGLIHSRRKGQIRIAHGNARSLRQLAIL